MRTPCAAAAPETWEGALTEILYTGLPVFASVALCGLISAIVQRVRARRAVQVLPNVAAPAQENEKVEVVLTDSKLAD
ncbi:hypothetical protein BV25DRAFT_1822013, partial [Artomyces pyxidatus]